MEENILEDWAIKLILNYEKYLNINSLILKC